MKYFSLLLLSLAVLYSCSNKDIADPDAEEPQAENPYLTGKDLSSAKQVTWESQWKDEPFLMVGYGYDATGKYAHPASIKNKVLDLVEMNQTQGMVVYSQNYFRFGPATYAQGTREESVRRMALSLDFDENDADKYKNLFKTTFDEAFENDGTFTDLPYRYYFFSQRSTTRLLGFYYFPNQWKNDTDRFLAAAFKQDLDNMAAEELIKTYGTHVMQGAVVGKKVDYLYRHTKHPSHDVKYWGVRRVQELFSVFPSMTAFPDYLEMGPPLKENLYMEVVDNHRPDTNAWMIDVTNYEGKRIIYEGWYEENSEEMEPTIVGFDARDATLIPIYEFVKNEAKKKALREAIERYLSE